MRTREGGTEKTKLFTIGPDDGNDLALALFHKEVRKGAARSRMTRKEFALTQMREAINEYRRAGHDISKEDADAALAAVAKEKW